MASFQEMDIAKDQLKKIEDEQLQAIIEKEMDGVPKGTKAYVDPAGFVLYEGKNPEKPVTLFMPHNGSWTPKDIPFKIGENKRMTVEEDLFVTDFYKALLDGNAQLMMSDHVSRYLRDLNRPEETAVLQNGVDEGYNFERFPGDENLIHETTLDYRRFYELIDRYIQDHPELKNGTAIHGHSMLPERDGKKRGDFCIAPSNDEDFELMKQDLTLQGFDDVRKNDPWPLYQGITHLVDHMAKKYGMSSTLFETNRKHILGDDKLSKRPEFDYNSERVTDALKNVISHID